MTEKQDNRYSHSKIYKLVDENNYYYYGSTCSPLHKRLYEHKEKSKREADRKIYTVFTHDRFVKGEIKVILVENLSLISKEELFREENKYISISIDDPFCLNTFHAVLNYERQKQQEIKHRKQYYENNKERFQERNKEYRQQHDEEIKLRSKQYREINKDKKREQDRKYRIENLDKIKEYQKQYRDEHAEDAKRYNVEYRKLNADSIQEKKVEFYESNKTEILRKQKEKRHQNIEESRLKDRELYNKHKEEILLKHKEKIICSCGKEITKYHLKRHLQTQRHTDLMKEKQEDET